jgi:hypothetical protein
MFTRGPSILTIIYVVIGIFVAQDHHYFSHVNNVEDVISAALAVVLWPLVLLDVNLHLKNS